MKHTVTLFKSVKTVEVGHNKPVEFVLKRIKEGKSKETVKKIRDGNSDLKKTLPGACFNGSFMQRNTNGLIEHSGLAIFDLDKIPAKELAKVRKSLEADEFVFFCLAFTVWKTV